MSATPDDTMVDLPERPRRLEDVIVRDVAGEVFLVPIRGRLADVDELFVLNPVGLWLWGRLDGTCSLEELGDDMLAHFAASPEEARADVRAFVAELAEAGLLEPDEAGRATASEESA